MSRRSSFSIPPAVLLGLFLTALALLVTWMKVDKLHMPLVPGEESELWTVESRIDFTGRAGPASVNFLLPEDTTGFTRVDENFVSRSFGLDVNDVSGRRAARWTLRRSEGEQSLFYRVQVYPEAEAFSSSYATDEAPEFPPVPDYPEPLASAIADVLSTARNESADIFSFANRLIATLANTEDENVRVIRDARPDSEWEELVTEILAGARIPSRVIQGVSLRDDFLDKQLVTWIEVFNGQRWRGFNPQTGEMGYPDRFYPWVRSGVDVMDVSGVRNLSVNFSVSKVSVAQERLAQRIEGRLLTGLMNFTLYSLPIPTQEVYKVLLLVPLGALVVAFMRVMIGIPTFGTFTPILISLAFRETQLGWGLSLFLMILFTGWLVRIALANLRLLLVPRLACMLVVVIALMVIMSLLSQRLGFTQGLSIALFPMVILTMTIERMSIVWEEFGTRETIKETLGTLIVAMSGYWVMNHPQLVHLMFNFPELLLVILTLCIAIGSYSGYRLSEVLRFKDLAKVDP
jgi:hypothetical protein